MLVSAAVDTVDTLPVRVGDPVVVGTAPLHALQPILSTDITGLKAYRSNPYKPSQALYYALKQAGDASAKNL